MTLFETKFVTFLAGLSPVGQQSSKVIPGVHIPQRHNPSYSSLKEKVDSIKNRNQLLYFNNRQPGVKHNVTFACDNEVPGAKNKSTGPHWYSQKESLKLPKTDMSELMAICNKNGPKSYQDEETEDDRSTTTSGSYVVDLDELKTEGEEVTMATSVVV